MALVKPMAKVLQHSLIDHRRQLVEALTDDLGITEVLCDLCNLLI